MSSFGRRTAPVSVLLNVYDLAPANEFLFPAGLGLYHSGVEIFGTEYTFADTAGVFSHPPKAVPNAKFRQQIDLGSCDPGSVQSAISALSSDEKFGPNDYNVIQNNCNHFSKALVWKLLQKQIPGYVNRMADIGAFCSCLIPKSLLENAPVNEDNKSETNSFLVKAPPNRSTNVVATSNSSSLGVFGGSGATLGGGPSSTTADALTDRREKARMAALARLERQQQQNDSDKSR